MIQAYLTAGGKVDIVEATIGTDINCGVASEDYKNLTGETIDVEDVKKTIFKGFASNECLITKSNEGDYYQEWTMAIGENSVQVDLTKLLPTDDVMKTKARVIVGLPGQDYYLEDGLTSRNGVYKCDRVNNKIEFKVNARRPQLVRLIIRA